MESQSEILLIIITGAISLISIFVFLFFVISKAMKGRPKGPHLVEFEVDPNVPFEIKYTIEHDYPHNLFLTYRIHASRIGGTASKGISSNSGILLTLDYYIDGEHKLHEAIGQGFALPSPADRAPTMEYFTSTQTGGSDYTRKATMPLMQFTPKPIGTEIIIKGKIEFNQFTTSSMLTLFITR